MFWQNVPFFIFLERAKKKIMAINQLSINAPRYGTRLKNGISISSDRLKDISVTDIRSSRHLKQVLRKHFLFKYSLEDVISGELTTDEPPLE